MIRRSKEKCVSNIPIIIGGNQSNEKVRQYVDVDYWVTDPIIGVRICQKLLENS